MRVITQEKDLAKRIKARLNELGITMIKTDVKKGVSIVDLVGYIIDENEQLTPAVAVEIKMKSNLDLNTQKKLFKSAKSIGCPYALLVVGDDTEEGIQEFWYDTNTFLPIQEPKFKSLSPYLQNPKDILNQIYNCLDVIRGNVMPHDYLHIIVELLMVRKYIEESGSISTVENMNMEQLNKYIQMATKVYDVEIQNYYEKVDEGSLIKILGNLKSLPPTSQHYYDVILTLVESAKIKAIGNYVSSQKLNEVTKDIVKTLELKGTAIDLASGLGFQMKSILTETNIEKFVGIETNRDIANLAKILSVISGIDAIEIQYKDGLQVMKEQQFDLVCYEPPMGPRFIGKEYPEYYVTGKGKRNRVDYSELFIEKSISLINENGYIVAIVPEGILFSSQSELVRELILEKTIVKAVISLPESINHPFSGIKLSVLILQRKTSNTEKPKEFFAGQIENIEEDKQDVISALEKWIKKEV